MNDKFEFVPANEKMLEIIRLHLEKYELLEAEDRKLYRGVLEAFLNPRLVITGGESV